ncbi:hypothetical protein DSOL_5410 [Desulfosporosinus metallidurans]|uniref:Uncharacterized protein n=1 Tax=Desulfosporosinus metallidurans TaxID=1888891 RepID=A0A1Q8QBL0_9FIRM|nr:hypothetical protein DSOL_5410 [Desulfosporosinus metallidurans]
MRLESQLHGLELDDAATVQSAALSGLVGGDRVGLTEADGLDAARINALLDEESLDGVGAALTKLHVVLLGADGVGVAFKDDLHAGLRLDDGGAFFKNGARTRA